MNPLAHLELSSLFQELNLRHFGGELPLPRLVWNSRLSSSAGRFCPGSRNPLRPRPPEIEVAAYLRELPEGEGHIRDTLLHEMVHYVLWFRGLPHGHTPEFHRILKQVGARRWNPVPKARPYKHWYQCPACFTTIPARRLFTRDSACASCCGKHNGGRYTARFLLRRFDSPPAVTKSVSTQAPLPPLPVPEILRRLEELKNMVLQRTNKNPPPT